MGRAMPPCPPKAKKTGNMSADLRAETNRQHLIDAINLLVLHENLRGDMVAQMRRLVEDASKSVTVGDHEWAEVTTLARMDEVWMASVISDWTGMKAEALAKTKAFDIDAVKQIWCFLLNASMLTTLPPEFKDKRVALQTLKQRMVACGQRADLVKSGFIKANGEVNRLLGAYALQFEAGKPKTITHRPTKALVSVDSDIGIDSSFVLVHNWNDCQAELQKGKARRFKLRAFFGKHEGPNSVEPWSGKSKELVAMAAANLREILDAEAPTGNTNEAAARTFAEQKELKRKSATETARLALQARNEEATKWRRISLAPPELEPAALTD